LGGRSSEHALDTECPLGIAEMKRLHSTVAQLSSNWDTVLITSGSGAGKEQVANVFIACRSARERRSLRERRLTAGNVDRRTVRLSAAPYRRTEDAPGQVRARRMAARCSDEIGDMPAGLQARVCCVLQDRSITRLGSEETVKLSVRVILATTSG
jgi:DNA-binding NtrC family response regulator